MTSQAEIIKELGVKPDFDVAKEVRSRIDFLKNYLYHSEATGFVLGISGGIDSTTAGKLAQMAVEELRTEGTLPYVSFTAVRLPYGTQRDEDEAEDALDFIDPDDVLIVDIRPAVDVLALSTKAAGNVYADEAGRDFHVGNIKARIRAVVQYNIAGASGELVIGTDHAAEGVMGFFTKFGDGAADILPLAGLNKRRVRAIAAYLGAPANLVHKDPTADLEDNRPGLPDEVAHGVTYDQIDDFLEGKEIDSDAAMIIMTAFEKTIHKRALPVAYA